MSCFRHFKNCVISGFLLLTSSPTFAAIATGHVVDPSGNPVAGASVTLMNYQNGDPTKFPIVQTDASGAFTQDIGDDNPQNTRHGCLIDAKGFAPSGGALKAGVENKFQLALPIQVSGTVVDSNNKPVAGALVQAQYADLTSIGSDGLQSERYVNLSELKPPTRYSTLTDARGSYTFSNIPPNCQLYVSLIDQKFATKAVQTTKGTLTAPPLTAITAVPIKGKVVGQDGKPITNVTIGARDITNLRQYIGSNAVSSSDGTYTINSLGAGTYQITVQAYSQPGQPPATWVPSAPVSITTSLGKPAVVPDITLDSGGVVTGTIVDAENQQPIADVNFSIQTQTSEASAGIHQVVGGRTDKNGQFTLHVWPGADVLSIDNWQLPDDYTVDQNSNTHPFKIGEGESVKLDPIGLKKSLSLTATVVDSSGNPVQGVGVTLMNNNGTWVNVERQTSDASGSVTLKKLAPGTYAIDSGANYEVTNPKTIDAPAAAPVTITVTKIKTIDVSGIVIDTSGAALSGVNVNYTVNYKRSDNAYQSVAPQVTTGNDGKFVVHDVPLTSQLTDWIQRTSVSKDGYLYRNGGDVAKSPDNITLSPIIMAQLGGSLDGLVKNGLDQPVAGAWVSSPDMGANTMPIQTDSTGHFKLANLAVGPINLYAGKGDYLGIKTTNAAITPPVLVITLDPMMAVPPALNIADATALYHQLQAISSVQNVYYTRDSCAAQLALVDRDAGINFLASEINYNSGDFSSILDSIKNINPETIAPWALPILQRIPDWSGTLLSDEINVGVIAAPYDYKSAKILFDLASKSERLTVINDQNIEQAAKYAVLAYDVQDPNADKDFTDVADAIKDIAKHPNPQQAQYDTEFLPGQILADLALGNMIRAEALIKALPSNDRYNAISNVVNELVQSYPDRAVAFFKDINSDTDIVPGNWPRDQAICSILPIMYKGNPDQAMDLAKASDQASVLVALADLEPMAEAAPLYTQAESKTSGQANYGDLSPACVAAHAWVRDKALGTVLFKQAYDKVIGGSPSDQYGQGPSYAEFAFYYARIDPAFCRILLENIYTTDKSNGQNYYGRGISVDAEAMCAIDINRAKAMAEGIKEDYNRFDAFTKIDQYLCASEAIRDTIPFDKWSQGQVSLHSGEKTGW